MAPTKKQGELIERFKAQDYADKFTEALEGETPPFAVLVQFVSHTGGSADCKKHDSYMFMRITGVGDLRNCFVWWMSDDSILIVGFQGDSEEEMSVLVGVLSPGSEFVPTPYTEAGIQTLH